MRTCEGSVLGGGLARGRFKGLFHTHDFENTFSLIHMYYSTFVLFVTFNDSNYATK